MDLNDARIVMTVIALAMFIGIVLWAYSDRRRQAFDKAARMALEDDEPIEHRRAQ